MKKRIWVLAILAVASAAGCAQKTASEQLQDDMKKASDKMSKDLKNF